MRTFAAPALADYRAAPAGGTASSAQVRPVAGRKLVDLVAVVADQGVTLVVVETESVREAPGR